MSVEDLQKQLEAIRPAISKRVHRRSHGKMSFTGIIRYTGKAWTELDNEPREVFMTLATEERTEHDKSLKQYNGLNNEIIETIPAEKKDKCIQEKMSLDEAIDISR